MPFFAFFLTPLGKKIGLAVGVIVLLIGARAYFVHQGVQQGKEQGKAEAADQLEQQHAADRANTQKQLDEYKRQADAAQARADAAYSAARQLGAVAQTIAQHQATSVAAQKAIPDAAQHDNNLQLLGRPATDRTPGYTFSEERAIGACLVQYPDCEARSKVMDEQIKKLQEGQQELSNRITTLNSRYDALENYDQRLEGYYVEAWNLIPKRRRSPACLWLWQCGAGRKLTIPAPDVVATGRPK